MTLEFLKTNILRRHFLQSAGAVGAAGIVAANTPGFARAAKAEAAKGEASKTVITKSFCHQCPARCGIDVYTTNGRVHAVYGTLDNPLSNGKLCPKGHYGPNILYDPDRFKGPMKRTNPAKGRKEDPKFVPISWDEALGILADRLNALRDKGDSHRFGILFGRGWGASDDGLFADWSALYGSPNVAIGHSSMCSDSSKKAKSAIDGNYSYNAYDYANTNYMLNFGAGYLESFRPLTANLRAWGVMRSKSPRTKVTAVDVHMNTTLAAADRALLIKPGTDGAMALAIAHVILTEGLWDKQFVGDFLPVVQPTDPAAPRIPAPKFESGKDIDAATFQQKWVQGLPEWWNVILKDCTPKWAEKITTIPAKEITTVAREFAMTKPAVALFERGASAHANGTYSGMAVHSLNALVGSLFAEGGLFYQMSAPLAKLAVKSDGFMDEYAKSPDRKKPRIDKVKTKDWPLASNMLQEVAKNHLAGNPYKLDTVMFYMTNPAHSGPDSTVWEKMLSEVFVVETSPYPGDTARFADLILPDHTYLERLQIATTYPFEGYPVAMIRTPAVKPLHDTRFFGDMLIDLGKRIKGSMSEYYKQLGNTENLIKEICKGFEAKPGDNGVNSFETFKEKGVWYKKPYSWRQIRGEFYEWDGQGYNKLMKPEEVKEKLLKTKSGKFEFKSSYLEDEHYSGYISEKLGVPVDRVGYPQFVLPRYEGGGDLHLVSPKLALQAEGRESNLPHAIVQMQPVQGGKKTVYLEIHPIAAKQRGIKDFDRVRIKSSVGMIEATARVYGGIRPDTVCLPRAHGHWGLGRWMKSGNGVTGSTNEVLPNFSDPISGLVAYNSGKVFVEKV